MSIKSEKTFTNFYQKENEEIPSKFFMEISHIFKTFLEVQNGRENISDLEKSKDIQSRSEDLPPFMRYLLKKELKSLESFED